MRRVSIFALGGLLKRGEEMNDMQISVSGGDKEGWTVWIEGLGDDIEIADAYGKARRFPNPWAAADKVRRALELGPTVSFSVSVQTDRPVTVPIDLNAAATRRSATLGKINGNAQKALGEYQASLGMMDGWGGLGGSKAARWLEATYRKASAELDTVEAARQLALLPMIELTPDS